MHLITQGAGQFVGSKSPSSYGWICCRLQLSGSYERDHEGEAWPQWRQLQLANRAASRPASKAFRIAVLLQAAPDCMKPLIGPLLRAMHRLAKEHNQSPASGLLSAKPDQPARYVTLHTACITSRYARPTVLLTDGHAAPLACRLQPTDATYGSGSWFMWNALNGVSMGGLADAWWPASSDLR